MLSSNDLRTRITAVLYDSGDMPASKAARLADAVIRELGLRQERQQGPYNFLYRYTTEFMCGDE